MIDIGTTVGGAADIGRGSVHNSQVRGGQDASTKIGKRSLDITGRLAVGRPEDSTSEIGESKRKVSTEGAAQFSAHTAGVKTYKGESCGRKHQWGY